MWPAVSASRGGFLSRLWGHPPRRCDPDQPVQRGAPALHQPLYRLSALAWRGVWKGLTGQFDEAERLARGAVRLAERAGDPYAQLPFTAQLGAGWREQAGLDEPATV